MRLILAAGLIAMAPALYAGSLTSADFTVDQIDDNVTSSSTSVGEFQVNNNFGTGFVNVLDSTGTQWLVQNLPVGLDAAGTTDFSRFLINSGGGSMATDDLIVNFSNTPLQTLADVNSADSTVETGLNVAQLTLDLGATGNSTDEAEVSAPGAGSILSFSSTIASVDYQTGHQNVEAGINQCAPAAVANSLTYLGLNGNYTNTPGTFGPTGGTGSLVAALDTYTGRSATGCSGGPCGVWPLDGKLQYINTLGNPNIVVNVQDGTGFAGTAGNGGSLNGLTQGQTYGTGAITATDQGAPSFDYIQSELRREKTLRSTSRSPARYPKRVAAPWQAPAGTMWRSPVRE